ncbi:MAG: heterodisulfide reductase-related iron-sulfur binding cluster [Trueperaceae bacterium]
MQYEKPVEDLIPQREEMTRAIQSCVHCGFCLPTCPTYVEMGEEMDSPRGRIFLMKEVLDGGLTLEEASPYIDNCLGCQACVTACPSGVEYGELLTPFRAWAEPRRQRAPMDRLQRLLLLETLPFPERFRLATLAGRMARPFARLLPERVRAMLELLPEHLPRAPQLPAVYAATGERRARVALLAGCAQRVLAPGINWATLRVLAENGVEVVIPPRQACCGALALHTGSEARAMATARRNLDAFVPGDVDAIVSNASGCGSGMKEYPLLFKGASEEAGAQEFADKVMDISSFLASLGARPAQGFPRPVRLVYHDACHLAHAQGVRSAPRDLLAAAPNLELLEPQEWELCCGSAGTYNIEKPDVAGALGERKAGNLLAAGGDAVATGNIGCMTQIGYHLNRLGRPLPVLHTVEVLDQAYRGVFQQELAPSG